MSELVTRAELVETLDIPQCDVTSALYDMKGEKIRDPRSKMPLKAYDRQKACERLIRFYEKRARNMEERAAHWYCVAERVKAFAGGTRNDEQAEHR